MPIKNQRFRFWLLATLPFALAALLLLAPLPGELARKHSHLLGEFQDFAHFPLFASVTIAFCWHFGLRKKWQLLAGLCVVLVFATGLEIAQSAMGTRETSYRDVFTNILGGIAGLSAWAAFFVQVRHMLLARVAAALVIAVTAALAISPAVQAARIYLAQETAFPTLYAPNFPGTSVLVESLGELDEVVLRTDKDRLSVDLLKQEDPVGVVFWEFRQNWSEYESLVIDISNLTSASLPLEMHVRDFGSTVAPEDRFTTRFELVGNERIQIRTGLDEISSGPTERTLDLRNASLIAIYRHSQGSNQFAVHEIRLE